MKNYSERMDKIFGELFKHRTLRTLFDPYSAEWNETTMEDKVAMLKKIIQNGENLETLIMEYNMNYKDSKPHVVTDAPLGIARILQYALSIKNGASIVKNRRTIKIPAKKTTKFKIGPGLKNPVKK